MPAMRTLSDLARLAAPLRRAIATAFRPSNSRSILPFMLTLYLGGVEVGDGLAIQFKSTLAARTVADLASQYVSIDNAAMSGILSAASDRDDALFVDRHGGDRLRNLHQFARQGHRAMERLAQRHGARGRLVGHAADQPANSQTSRFIYGEVTYPYTPSMGYVLTGTINIYQSIYFYPRLSSSIQCVSC